MEAKQPMHDTGKRKRISIDSVRQGSTKHRVRYVLGFGIIFAIAAMVAVYIFQ